MGLFKLGGFLDRWRGRASEPAPQQPVPAAASEPPIPKKSRAGNYQRTSTRIRWDDHPEANKIIIEHYTTHQPEVIAAMVAPLFPGRTITKNQIIGRANRLQLRAYPDRRPRDS